MTIINKLNSIKLLIKKYKSYLYMGDTDISAFNESQVLLNLILNPNTEFSLISYYNKVIENSVLIPNSDSKNSQALPEISLAKSTNAYDEVLSFYLMNQMKKLIFFNFDVDADPVSFVKTLNSCCLLLMIYVYLSKKIFINDCGKLVLLHLIS